MGSKSNTTTNVSTSADTQILGSGENSFALEGSSYFGMGSNVDQSTYSGGDFQGVAGGNLTFNSLDNGAIAEALKFASGNGQQTAALVSEINAMRSSEVESLLDAGADMFNKSNLFNSESTQKTNDGLRAAFSAANNANNPNMPYYLLGAGVLVLWLMKGH